MVFFIYLRLGPAPMTVSEAQIQRVSYVTYLTNQSHQLSGVRIGISQVSLCFRLQSTKRSTKGSENARDKLPEKTQVCSHHFPQHCFEIFTQLGFATKLKLKHNVLPAINPGDITSNM